MQRMIAVTPRKVFLLQLGVSGRAVPIGAFGFPEKVQLMRCGFETEQRGGLYFEGETECAVRFCERSWAFRQNPDPSRLMSEQRWRLEFAIAIEKRGPICPGHTLVLAQEPYENAWLQRAQVRQYSKKAPAKPTQPVPEFEALKRQQISDPVEWIERSTKADLWERNSRYIAGFSRPNGFLSVQPRNSACGFVVGICPDFDRLVSMLLTTPEIRRAINDARHNRIVFWNRRKVKVRLTLHPEVIEEAEHLMMISVQQALAGPKCSAEKWINRSVWELARWIFLDHLNAHNRRVVAQSSRNITFDENRQFEVEERDRWRIRKLKRG